MLVTVNLTDFISGNGNVGVKTSSLSKDFSSVVTLAVISINLYTHGSIGSLTASNYSVERAVSMTDYTFANAIKTLKGIGVTVIVVAGIVQVVASQGTESSLLQDI